MRHRHFLNEHDQGWNRMQSEHPCTNLARSGTSETRSHVYPEENILNERMPESSHWNSPVPNSYTASGHRLERQHYDPRASGPSHDPFVSSTVASFSAPHENHVTFASSSNCNSQNWSNASYGDLSMENLRGAQKRKSPSASSIYEMGSSSHYHDDRISPDSPFPSDLHMGNSVKHDHDPHYMPWLMNQSNTPLIRGEGSSRNVRSRPTVDLETSLDRNNLPRCPRTDSHSKFHQNFEHAGSGQFPSHTSHGSKDWNRGRLSPVPRDINGFNPETNNFLAARCVVNRTSVDIPGYHHGFTGNRNPTVPHGFPGNFTQSTSSSHFSNRSTPTYGSSSHGSQLGHVASSSVDRSHMVTETYPSRPLRPAPHISWRSGDRSRRRRSSYERFQPPPFEEVALQERYSSEEFMVVDGQPHNYGSINMFDHHRDMRLDIDNMTYEELLALGERIGNVNTGLSDSAISSCLLATTYKPLYQTYEQNKCSICLEEYKEKEELEELKRCGHEYHGICIKKWLSIKNSCPICKAPALPDASENPS